MCVYYKLLPSVVVHTYKDTRLQNMDESSWKNMFCVHQYVSSLHTGHWPVRIMLISSDPLLFEPSLHTSQSNNKPW
jgi:hypothetical protein